MKTRSSPRTRHHAVRTVSYEGMGGAPILCAIEDTDSTKIFCTKSALYAISPNGSTAMVAGHESETGHVDGARGQVRFNNPYAMVIDTSKRLLYLTDFSNHVLRMVHLASGATETIAGDGVPGYREGAGTHARFNSPAGMAMDAEGVLFVADQENNCVRRVQVGYPGTHATVSLLLGGVFSLPMGMTFDLTGDLLVADSCHNSIKKLRMGTGECTAETFAGSDILPGIDSNVFHRDGPSTHARFNMPMDVAMDIKGNVIVADTGNHVVRVIFANGRVGTIAGSTEHDQDPMGDGPYMQERVDGVGWSVRFCRPDRLLIDRSGLLHVFDAQEDSSVRQILLSL